MAKDAPAAARRSTPVKAKPPKGASVPDPPVPGALPGHLRGAKLLDDPVFNKGTAFTEAERDALGLHGLLPEAVEPLDEQCARAYEAYQKQANDLQRHIFLRDLQDTNEVLFYALMLRHITEMTPMVYDPVVAQGCMYFSHIYRRARGLFFSYPLRDRMEQMLENRPYRDVDVIVVTDGERILGIGDQGAGGMGIPIGKLSLYTLIGGVRPSRTLPITLDVGTNNPERLKDPEYLGWRHERITGDAYWDFVDQFVNLIQRKLPHVLLQWEDFARPHARPILDKYVDQLCTFNDDIQGTAAVTLGALYGALKAAKTQFTDQQVVILGAGGAGTGIADYILAAMMAEGLSEKDALQRFYLVDLDGLLHTGMTGMTPIWQKYARPVEQVRGWATSADGKISLHDVVRNIKATILIGVSTQPNRFTLPIVREMASKVPRPIIFPLSNPNDRAEAAPADLMRWTDGKALVATGAPFAPVKYNGRDMRIGQANNFYIFPAIGTAVAASGAKRVTDRMMLAAARALGDKSPALDDPTEPLLPPLEGIHEVVRHIAEQVGMEAQRAGLAPATGPEQLRKRITEKLWMPHYDSFVSTSKEHAT